MGERDLFTLEMIKDTLVSIADEIFVSLARTSRSSNIYETLDYSCGITDGGGQTIAECTGAPVFSGVISSAVKEATRAYGREGLADGDVIMMNDPLSAGTHLNDVTLVLPVFIDHELAAFGVSKAHWMDVGGPNPGSWSTTATEIFQEGILIPPVKLYSRGVLNRELLDVIKSNVRISPEEYSQVAALRLGAKRIVNLCKKYGVETYRRAVRRYIEYGSQTSYRALKNLPKGTFEADDYVDNDGLSDKPIYVKAKVTISDDLFQVDYTGSAPQNRGPFNCSLVATKCGAGIAFRAVTDPHGPSNDGFYRPLRVIAPRGTLFNAQRPAPFSNYYELVSYAADLICKALSKDIPGILPAGGSLSPCPTLFAGTDVKDQTFVIHEDHYGGWGASMKRDGQNVLCPYIDGDTRLFSAEILEAKYPLLIEQYALNTLDKSGAGKFRGGLGCVKDYRIMDPRIRSVTGVFGRSKFPPWGVHGGKDGSCNYMLIFNARANKPLRKDKITGLPLKVGDMVRLVTGNGAGYGSPLRRDPRLVLQDILEGCITVRDAKDAYGVIAKKNGRELDLIETRKLRMKLLKHNRPRAEGVRCGRSTLQGA